MSAFRSLFILLMLTGPAVAAPQEIGPQRDPKVAALVADVDPKVLKETISALVGFGTRHTLSDAASPVRGIGAARSYVARRFAGFGAACGGCLEVVRPSIVFSGERIAKPTRVEDVVAIQRGTTDPSRVIIISGHVDSRVTDPNDASSDAPGANDDGSGTAAVLEAARVLSGARFPATVVYAVLSGEEQGLYGGRVLASLARERGWRVEAVLNNDIIGNSAGQDGRTVDHEVRVFSEGVRAGETPAMAQERRRAGGEIDSPSREIARYLPQVAATYVPDLKVRMIYRADRFGRGGDQGPMQEAGYPAVRLTEGDENYARQHQNVRTEAGVAYGDVLAGVDFPYLARVVRLNAAALALLASAPPPPDDLKISGAVTADTTLSWRPVPGAAAYRVYWRETTAPLWSESRTTAAPTLVLRGVNIDDYAFGVASVSTDGAESPVEFPGAVGAFFPETPLEYGR